MFDLLKLVRRDRKAILLTCAAFRSSLHHKQEESDLVATVVEQFADGNAELHDVNRVAADNLYDDEEGFNQVYAAYMCYMESDVSLITLSHGRFLANKHVATLLRDIFGNPFRPVTFAPEWRTEAAVGIAAKMYDSRDFGNMPILADALQDAGCEHADILAHCREPGTHVRGCWVVDLVLGKA
jgi:hypothetical protein